MRVDSAILDPKRTLRDIVNALANNLTVEENLQAAVISVTSPTADEEFSVPHNLGRVPIAYLANVDQAAIVYDSRRNEWTDSVLYLKCDTTGVEVTLVVL